MTETTSTVTADLAPYTIEGIVLMDADEARQATVRIRTTASELRRDIFDFNARLGWRALGYASFRDWATAELDQSIRHTYRQLAAAEAEADLGVTIGHTPEAHLRPLAGVPTEDRAAVWARANELAGDEAERTAAHVTQAVAEYDSLIEAFADLQRRAGALAMAVERRQRSLDGAWAMLLCGPEPEVERSYAFHLTPDGLRDIASETAALISLNSFLCIAEEDALSDAETLTPYEAAVAAQHETRLRAEAAAAEARADGDAALAALRGAMRAGPFRWPEAEAQIAALPAEQRPAWQSDLNQLRRIDQQLRDRQWQGLQRLVDNIADEELRAFQVVIIRGAVRELALPWPFSSEEHGLGIAAGTPAEHIPDTWDEWRGRAQAIRHSLTLGLHGVYTVSVPGQVLYSGTSWMEAIVLIRRRELKSDATVEPENNKADQEPAAESKLDEAYVADLQRRAAVFGYEMKVTSKGAVRWSKNGQPWGGSKDLNGAEMQVCAWENQAHQVARETTARERAQASASLMLTDHDALYSRYEQELAALLERIGDDGAVMLALTMFPEDEGDPADILWENWTTAAQNLSTADLRRALRLALMAEAA